MTGLQERFCAHPGHHPSLCWDEVERLLSPEKTAAVSWMEETGGEPEAVVWKGVPIVAELSPESPLRRSVCYDREARLKRKKNAPSASAWELADAHGVLLADEELYGFLQTLGPLDQKTSSWIATPEEIRSQGGALFGSSKYGRTFIYHNGADSYYAARGFRCFFRLG